MKRLLFIACVLGGCAQSSGDTGEAPDGGEADSASDARADGGVAHDASADVADGASGDDAAPIDGSDSRDVVVDVADVGADCSGVVAQPQSGLVAYYRFEETTGMVCDWSGHGHHGTVTGTGYMRGVAGVVGSAIAFTGTDGTVVVPASTDLDFSTAATIELFLRVDSTSGVGGPLSRGTGNSDPNVLMDTSCGNVQLIFSRVGGTTNTTSACNLLTQGVFAHVAYVNDGATLKLYKDGNFVASQTGGQMGPITTDLYIGKRQQGIFPLNGAVDEIRWWTIARTQAQVCGDAGKTWNGTMCQ